MGEGEAVVDFLPPMSAAGVYQIVGHFQYHQIFLAREVLGAEGEEEHNIGSLMVADEFVDNIDHLINII